MHAPRTHTNASAQEPNSVLNEWSADLNRLMAGIERVTHLIAKEEMMAAAAAARME